MGILALVLAALLPAVALCIYVFLKDRVEKEPVGLLLGLFLLGAVSCFPAIFLELAFSGLFGGIGESAENAQGIARYLSVAWENFVGVALVEEACKWVILYLVTRNSKHFDSLFDGIVYAVFVSLGFAALENVLYAFGFGMGTTLTRAFTSIPGHMFFGVMMGYYYSWWHAQKIAQNYERELRASGIIGGARSQFRPGTLLWRSLLYPVFLHGMYDFTCSMQTGWMILMFFAFLIILYVHSFRTVKEMSKNDSKNYKVAFVLLEKSYPGLWERIAPR